MLKNEVEKKLVTYLSLGSCFVTVFLLANTNTDPVNVTKLFALGGISIAVFAISIFFGAKQLISFHKPFLAFTLLFNLVMIFASVASEAPFSQNYFGAFGRNNGLLTYSLLSLLMISTLLLSKVDSFEKIIYGLFAAGLINIVYCSWVLIFGDFIPWNNPYGNILGLFGNPDFISAFFGMFISGALAFIVSSKTRTSIKFFLGIASTIALLEIIKSQAIQGLVVTAGGAAIIGFYFLKSSFRSPFIRYGYSVAVGVIGFLALAGSLQKGPLSFIYKRSVSLRGSYWRAGIEMGNSHPLTGVGLDTYGDWYRSARPPVALIDTPGISIVSNVSHNVVIDFFASGGFPLLICYLVILAFGAISIIRVTLRSIAYERVFVALATIWICYQVQSLISINQIGLAVWGWLFTGLLVAYEHRSRIQTQSPPDLKEKVNKASDRNHPGIVSPQLVAGIGLISGLLIAFPPLNADAKWFAATNSHDVAKVESALESSFFNPSDSYRYALAVNIFQSSNLLELALKYARIGVEFNPNYFVAWKQMYLLPNSTVKEKALALTNMKRLDPNNPNVTVGL